jgi:hypothetical protein
VKTLQQAILEKVTQEIERRKEAQRQAQKEAEQLKQAEEMAATDAMVLIQRLAGFRLDGWQCHARFDFRDGGTETPTARAYPTVGTQATQAKDYFRICLTADSGHQGHPHRINFETRAGCSRSMLVVSREGPVEFQITGPLTAIHLINSGGASKAAEFSDILEALIFAQFGDIGPEAILESLGDAAQS